MDCLRRFRIMRLHFCVIGQHQNMSKWWKVSLVSYFWHTCRSYELIFCFFFQKKRIVITNSQFVPKTRSLLLKKPKCSACSLALLRVFSIIISCRLWRCWRRGYGVLEIRVPQPPPLLPPTNHQPPTTHQLTTRQPPPSTSTSTFLRTKSCVSGLCPPIDAPMLEGDHVIDFKLGYVHPALRKILYPIFNNMNLWNLKQKLATNHRIIIDNILLLTPFLPLLCSWEQPIVFILFQISSLLLQCNIKYWLRIWPDFPRNQPPFFWSQPLFLRSCPKPCNSGK